MDLFTSSKISLSIYNFWDGCRKTSKSKIILRLLRPTWMCVLETCYSFLKYLAWSSPAVTWPLLRYCDVISAKHWKERKLRFADHKNRVIIVLLRLTIPTSEEMRSTLLWRCAWAFVWHFHALSTEFFKLQVLFCFVMCDVWFYAVGFRCSSPSDD